MQRKKFDEIIQALGGTKRIKSVGQVEESGSTKDCVAMNENARRETCEETVVEFYLEQRAASSESWWRENRTCLPKSHHGSVESWACKGDHTVACM